MIVTVIKLHVVEIEYKTDLVGARPPYDMAGARPPYSRVTKLDDRKYEVSGVGRGL